MGKNEFPDWLKSRLTRKKQAESLKNTFKTKNLHTVCEEAKCPNIGECFREGTATFLIMGNICTRNCGFCSIQTGIPKPLDESEPVRIARQIKQMKLKYTVLTSPTRDDLDDGGSSFFASTVKKIKEINFSTGVEVLIPDFKGNMSALETVLSSGVNVLNHNIETVKRLYPKVRSQGDYNRTLDILKKAFSNSSGFPIKSGFMVGLGEKKVEIKELLEDLRAVGCNIITVGQYLRPTLRQLPVFRYLHPEEFKEIEEMAYGIGFDCVVSGPLVRSSYKAEEIFSLFRKDPSDQLNG